MRTHAYESGARTCQTYLRLDLSNRLTALAFAVLAVLIPMLGDLTTRPWTMIGAGVVLVIVAGCLGLTGAQYRASISEISEALARAEERDGTGIASRDRAPHSTRRERYAGAMPPLVLGVVGLGHATIGLSLVAGAPSVTVLLAVCALALVTLVVFLTVREIEQTSEDLNRTLDQAPAGQVCRNCGAIFSGTTGARCHACGVRRSA